MRSTRDDGNFVAAVTSGRVFWRFAEIRPRYVLACPHAESTHAWSGGPKVVAQATGANLLKEARKLFQREPDS